MRVGEAGGGVARMARACAGIAMTLAALPFARAAEPLLPPPGEARPSLPPAPEPAGVPWEQHVEVGGGVAFTQMLATIDGDGRPTSVRFKPAVGFHIELSWQVLRYLGVTGYVVEHDHPLFLPFGALDVPGQINPASAHAYSFGVRASPTIPLGPRVLLWLTAGGGWGRVEYGTMTVAGANILLPARAESLFEIPLGLGGSVEIIPRWLSLRLEVTGAFLPSQIGDALQHGQFIRGGAMADFFPMPRLDATFVETLGLMLHL